ncbi:MAG: ADP-forming succinate--CoA ligase subunit beta [Anaerolineaceae bacterium]|nr:ADP-forming succinate--CoA ligase subunit beta [Anaerolineaceae bacterium]
MKIHEYQCKLIFSRYRIPVPKGQVAVTASEAKDIAEELGGRVVIKAQVLVGGRGMAGGIRLAKSSEEAEELATSILSMEIKGLPVHKVLVDEAVNIDQELYLGITNDRRAKMPVLMTSAEGGASIEETAAIHPEKIYKAYIHPLLGLRDYQARDLAAGIDLPRELWRPFVEIARGLWEAYTECDATMAEINPLVITQDHHLLALDGKMALDDNALFRHQDLADLRDKDAETPQEIEARKYGLSYVKLDGNIVCMVNGAGLAMATMDLIKLHGGAPANFLDVGGGASAEKVAAALRILFSDSNLRSVLINIFGGITRCDEVARGILAVLSDDNPSIPIIVRFVGNNAAKGLRMVAEANLETADSLSEASKRAVALAMGA